MAHDHPSVSIVIPTRHRPDALRRYHAYCVMGNHSHLLIETPEANPSRGMRHLNGVCAQRFNRVHERVGHVFQGRFKAILVWNTTVSRWIEVHEKKE